MAKKYKILLPFSLYEELENIDQLNPEEMKSFLLSLKRYCDSTGKDFSKACNDLEIEQPEWAGKLTPKQIEALDMGVKSPYSWKSDESSWSINPETGLVDIKGDFQVSSSSHIRKFKNLIGIKFGKVEGNFVISTCGLTTLEGSPLEVTGNFQAHGNNFEDLKGSPKKVGGSFYVNNNSNLISLEGAPEEVEGEFSVESCIKLTSLKGSPERIGGSMNVSSTSIKDLIGCPKEIGSQYKNLRFDADKCYDLVSLEGAPILIKVSGGYSLPTYDFKNCPNLYSLEGLPLTGEYSVSLDKNGLKPSILKNALAIAKNTKSWIVAYLSMFTDPDFIKTGKAPKDPIREKLAPDNIKKEIEENGERFVVGLKSIWNDFRVKKILREIEIPEDTKADADMLSALDDIGL